MLSNFTSVQPTLNLDFINTTFLDPRITFSRNSIATRFDQNGNLETLSANQPRIDFDPTTKAQRGLLIEEARTNSIRNNTMVGAVTGSPGTLPTYWQIYNPQSLTRNITAIGVENGIPYIEITVTGTATSTTQFDIGVDSSSLISASSGQTWTHSAWLAQIGSATNATPRLLISGRDTPSLVETENTGINPSLSSTLTRFSVTRTFNSASTAWAYPYINVLIPSAGAVSLTIRIGMPQLELGAFLTSVIPTSTGAVIRQADLASVNDLVPWYNATEGTIYSEATFTNTVSYNTVVSLDNGSPTTSIRTIQWNDGSDRILSVSDTSTQAGYVGTAQVGTAKFAGAYKINDFNASKNGSIGVTDTSGNIPTITALNLGKTGSSSFILNGYLRRVVYYPIRLLNVQLQALTAS
jgi:hypothetical protein